MIFGSNTTALSASTIPMAEGYDCSYGVGLALVESARNDLAMFQALVQADYKEMAICKESTGVMQEGEIATLHEAVGGGIFKKIAELFKKLVAKVKAIFHSFMTKINGLTMKDKELVKKYSKELARKRNLDKLEVKWRKRKSGTDFTAKNFSTVAAGFKKAEGWTEDSWDRVKFCLHKDVESTNEYVEVCLEEAFEDEDTVKLGEIGGWRAVAGFINEHAGKLKTMQSEINKGTTALEKLVKEYDKAASNAAGESVKDKENTEKAAAVETANKEYDMAQAYQTAMLTAMDVATKIVTIDYKQNKAAFMKAVSVNEKKLEESSVLVDAIVEAAEEEVDNVINSALSDEEISDLCAASTNVKDADVSDDPDKLTYGPDNYTDNASFDDAEGEIDTCVGGGKVEESAYFGKMFY